MADEAAAPVLVVGVGNPMRGDDAAGLQAVRLLRELVDPRRIAVCEQEGSPVGLIDLWEGARAALIIDAVSSGAPAGTIQRFDLAAGPPPVRLRGASTHALGPVEAVELGRTLGRLPPRVVLYGVEGASYEAGEELSEAVAAVIPQLARRVLEEARTLARPRSNRQ